MIIDGNGARKDQPVFIPVILGSDDSGALSRLRGPDDARGMKQSPRPQRIPEADTQLGS